MVLAFPKSEKPLNIEIILVLAFISTLFRVINTYFFRDWEFLKWLFVLMVLDTVLGVVKSWINHDISSRAFSRVVTKIVVYGAALVVTNVLQNFTIRGQHPGILDWFAYFALVSMIIRESISVLENVVAINPNILPIWLLPRLKAVEYQVADKQFEKPPDISDAPN